jgi:hypothetical protein
VTTFGWVEISTASDGAYIGKMIFEVGMQPGDALGTQVEGGHGVYGSHEVERKFVAIVFSQRPNHGPVSFVYFGCPEKQSIYVCLSNKSPNRDTGTYGFENWQSF